MRAFDDKKRSTPVFDPGTYWGVQKYAYNGDDLEYLGRNTAADAADDDPTWFILKYTFSAGTLTNIELLEGAWDNRASLDWR